MVAVSLMEKPLSSGESTVVQNITCETEVVEEVEASHEVEVDIDQEQAGVFCTALVHSQLFLICLYNTHILWLCAQLPFSNMLIVLLVFLLSGSLLLGHKAGEVSCRH